MRQVLLLYKSNFTPATRLDFWVENEKLYVTLAHIVHDILVIALSLLSSSSTLLYTQGERFRCGVSAHLYSSNSSIINYWVSFSNLLYTQGEKYTCGLTAH